MMKIVEDVSNGWKATRLQNADCLSGSLGVSAIRVLGG